MTKLKLIKPIHVPIALMMLAGAAMIGLTDFLAGNLTLDTLKSPDFWNNLLTTNLGIVCMLVAVILITTDEYVNNNPQYLTLKNFIFKFYLEKYIAPVFKLFLAEENKQRKINEYRMKLQTKYDKLTSRASQKNLDIFYGKDEQLKLKNKFCIREKQLSKQLEDCEILKVIDKTNIQYDSITESLVFSGVSHTNVQANRYIVKNKVKKVFIDLFPKFLLTFAISILGSVIAPAFKEDVIIFPILVKLFIITTQIYFARDYAKNIYCPQILQDEIEFRHSIITSFELWVRNRGKEVNSNELI